MRGRVVGAVGFIALAVALVASVRQSAKVKDQLSDCRGGFDIRGQSIALLRQEMRESGEQLDKDRELLKEMEKALSDCEDSSTRAINTATKYGRTYDELYRIEQKCVAYLRECRSGKP